MVAGDGVTIKVMRHEEKAMKTDHARTSAPVDRLVRLPRANRPLGISDIGLGVVVRYHGWQDGQWSAVVAVSEHGVSIVCHGKVSFLNWSCLQNGWLMKRGDKSTWEKCGHD